LFRKKTLKKFASAKKINLLRMKINFAFIILFFYLLLNSYGQLPKQGNTANAEIFADAPYRMNILNSQGNLCPIPIHIFAHDADGTSANIKLMSIDIYIKNASDTAYSDLITFDTYSPAEFDSLIIHHSPDNPDMNVQNFNNSQYETSTNHTIVFKETHDILDGEDYVEINQKFWYFTLMIPAEILNGYDSIIDFKVYFNIDWSVDDETHLRIFRYSTDLPKIENWYRGDTHYHTIFTQNVAETGEAIEATRMAGKYTGIDWQFTSDHSCDFDNYGISMANNWQALGNQIQQQNTLDTDYVMIRGMEMSVNNNNGEVVHALVYPNPEQPFSLPYISDGGGDYSSTTINVDMMLDSITKYGGLCYAAHPFAEGDKLPDLINGNVWNINNSDFPENGMPHPSNGTVICNNLSTPSDVFSADTNYLFKKSLYGFQIWNLYNSVTSDNSDNYYNPFNSEYDSSIASVSQLSINDSKHFMYRFWQGLDIVKFFLQKGLIEKNNKPWLQHWKTYLLAGSDAHGSFNFSNTNMYIANFGTIEDNAIGRLNSLVYLPQGKGQDGKNIIKALKEGHTVISNGPVITMHIESTSSNGSILPGTDTIINYTDLQHYNIVFNVATTYEFGTIEEVKIILGTETEEYTYPMNIQNTASFNLLDFLNNLFLNSISTDKYFYIRAELTTHKDYGTNATLYKKQEEDFYSFTNPIWLKIANNAATNTYELNAELLSVYSGTEQVTVIYNNVEIEKIKLFNALGQCVNITDNNRMVIDRNQFNKGIYIIKVSDKNGNTIIRKIYL